MNKLPIAAAGIVAMLTTSVLFAYAEPSEGITPAENDAVHYCRTHLEAEDQLLYDALLACALSEDPTERALNSRSVSTRRTTNSRLPSTAATMLSSSIIPSSSGSMRETAHSSTLTGASSSMRALITSLSSSPGLSLNGTRSWKLLKMLLTPSSLRSISTRARR